MNCGSSSSDRRNLPCRRCNRWRRARRSRWRWWSRRPQRAGRRSKWPRNALGLPVYKPETLRDPASREPLIAAEPDLFVVAAFGLIFRQRTLDIPRLGSINVHPSLLPKYRGASPIVAAIAAGDRETGVALMVMDAGIDTGAVVSQERAPVADDDTSESLGARLARMGAEMAVRDIPRWVKGELVASPQRGSQASLTRTLTKADGWIDWTRAGGRNRASDPRHVAVAARLDDHSRIADADPRRVGCGRRAWRRTSPETVISARRRLIVACGEDALEIQTVEPAGRRTMAASAYLNGLRGRSFGSERRGAGAGAAVDRSRRDLMVAARKDEIPPASE